MAIYQIDPSHSNAEFGVKHILTTVKGRFGKVDGEIEFDAADPRRGSITATTEVASITTGDAQRDGHLLSPDFFDAESYPAITFKSRRIERSGRDGEYRVIGDLTIRDVTREVAFDASHWGEAQDPWGGTRAGFSASAVIDRKDYGLQWNVELEAGGLLVGDTVKITLDIEAVKKTDELVPDEQAAA